MKERIDARRKLCLCIVFYSILGFSNLYYSAATEAKTYYVCPSGSDQWGKGTYENPWFSPIKARKSNSELVSGDEVIFKNGTYVYLSDICLLGYSGDDSGITYKAETKGGVILDFQANWGWRLSTNGVNNADNTTIDGFIIVNCTAGVVFKSLGGVVRNVNFTSAKAWPVNEGDLPLANSGGQGAFVSHKGSEFLIENCIADMTSEKSDGHGIYIAGGSGTIRNNIVRNNAGAGILIQAKNVDYDIGIVDVYENKIHDNGLTGIAIRADNAGSVGSGTIADANIYNNLIYNSGTDGIKAIEVNGASTRADIYNNTLYNNAKGLWHIGSGGSLQNNLSIDTTGGDDVTYTTTKNSNIIYSNNLYTADFDSSNFVSIDPADIEKFLKLKSTATAAINKGALIAALTNDYFGAERSDGGHDIGAHEYNGVVAEEDTTPPASPTGLTVQ